MKECSNKLGSAGIVGRCSEMTKTGANVGGKLHYEKPRDVSISAAQLK
jgi:hypothetical protein